MGAAAEESHSDGISTTFDTATHSKRFDGIRPTLRELGYIEGQNIVIERRYGEGKSDRLPQLAAELARLKVDIVVATGGTTAVLAAKNATGTISIVMTGQGRDPVKAGLVASPQSCPGRGSLRSGHCGQCARCERGSPSGCACAWIDFSVLGATSRG